VILRLFLALGESVWYHTFKGFAGVEPLKTKNAGKFMTVLWPLIVFVSIIVFLVLFRRPLRQILERFDCSDVSRLRMGPFEIEKQSCPKHTRAHRRRKKRPSRG
jgi:hypothetical protein